jgi:serine protease AprX
MIASRRRLRGVLVGVLLAAGLGPAAAAGASAGTIAPAAPATALAAAGDSPDAARLIVRTAGDDSAVDVAVRAAGGRLVARQPGLGMLVVEGPAGLSAALAATPGVLGVAPDRKVRLNSLGFDPMTQPGSLTKVTQLTGATGMWKAGYTGSGVDVALIDTGVAPVPGLSAATKVVVGPDLSFESQSASTRYLDSYGHGTHMAGVIAGRETGAASGTTYAANTSNFYGMAPDSRVLSIKVADHNGTVDVSQVIAAINWVVQFGKSNGLKVRVMNLSFGLDSPQSPAVDPLSWAAEVAWSRGIVVVASAGNQGDQYPGLNSPAFNPRILAVGAVDTKGTSSISDDTVPSFSAVQGGNWGSRGIDLLAPGVGIVSLRVPGSSLADAYPGAKVATNFLRGSGTSQAAAVVSGAVALLLQQRPSLTPDQVKALLLNTATAIPGVPTGSQGKGELNLAAAAAAAVPGTVQSVAAGSGTGSLESARGGMHVSLDGSQLQGELHLFGQWQGATTATKIGNATMWSSDGSTWNGVAITGAGFTTDTTTAAGKAWGGRSWAGRSWAGNTWTGRSWASCSFVGRSWAGSGWSSGSWSAPITTNSWTGALWSTGDWK